MPNEVPVDTESVELTAFSSAPEFEGLSWIQALLSLHFEFSNFNVHTCILFVDVSW